MSRGLGTIQQKVLLLLLGGLALGLSGSPNRYFKILKMIGREWKEIDKHALKRAIQKLYYSRLVQATANKDGSTTLTLSENGKRRALTFKLGEMEIPKPNSWDKKWRVVIFDIPESRKGVRSSLRYQLCRLGFYKLQKSVFIHPYPCSDEVDFIIELYHVRPYVRQLVVEALDNELHLKKIFQLI
ncbi:MAG: CRISPR-associated endonuclease Cas2 [Candidatus Sungiibacteriota bacterium]|uniref:CRISPR-associated endonuclease Cas2 n=1 Tax=Candidatus Sungiibacteriota bacterium TaxID=2750080 RepID=A0A7T5RJL2_9BACT|nr:MAG: CRISPR-associated endonuclease Cas2 [Candidatus Sungbacteria bacterium]